MANVKIGEQAIDFNLPSVTGGTVSLHSPALKGKRAIGVVFWCNHCPYVVAWEDRMIEIQKDYAHRGVAFVAICANDPVSYPQDSFENMAKRAQERAYPFPYLHDATQQTARSYGAQRTPEVFLFDAELKLVYHGAIDDNHSDRAAVRQRFVRDALDAVLAGGAPAVQESHPVGCTIKWVGM
jgi:peroxiredoxin